MKIHQYIQGARTGKEANHTEYQAMKDSFLSDALDGYTATKGNQKRQIEKLQNTITRKCKNKPNYARIGGIAAGITVVLGIGAYCLFIQPDVFKNLFTQADNIPKKETTHTKKKPVTETKVAEQTNTEKMAKAPEAESIKKTTNAENIAPAVSPVLANPNKPDLQTRDTKNTGTVENTSKESPTVVTDKPANLQPPIATPSEIKPNQTISPSVNTEITEPVVSENKSELPATQPVEETAQPAQPTQPAVNEETVKPKIKGKVTDKNGNPLSGATVSAVGANKRTTTNANGYFELEAEDNSNLMVRSLGYDPVILTGSIGQNLQVIMEEVPKE